MKCSLTAKDCVIPYLALCKIFLRSEIRVLRRFPVSDEFISDRYTFCVIFDRKHFLDFLNYWFWTKGHVTPEDMDLSRIALRIEWKHFRIPEGPAYGRNRPLKSRNLGFRHEGIFFQSFGKIEK